MTITPGARRLPAERATLIVLDGWGPAPDGPGNAISLARTPVGLELRSGGVLADVAPTLLTLLGFEPPAAMTGRLLISA